MRKITVGQKRFIAEFLGNYSLAWVVGLVVTPIFTNVVQYSWYTITLGIINASWTFLVGFIISKDIKL